MSAGFDAHMDDPLGAMRVTTQQFGRLTGLISAVADDCCEGRMVVVTEGATICAPSPGHCVRSSKY